MTPDAFIAAHTTVDTTLSISEECPICLDNYAYETCLLITGIPGCTHHIGETCLRVMLSSQPAAEKRCPLCRTVWIAAAAARPRVQWLPIARPGGSILDPRTQLWQANIYSNDDDAVSGAHEALPRTEAARTEAPASRPLTALHELPSQFISIDSDSEPEDYAGLTRDIESVRARARNTQLSRGQRRQPLRVRTPQVGHSTGVNAVVVEADDGARNRSLFGNVFRQSTTPLGVNVGSSTNPAPTPRLPALINANGGVPPDPLDRSAASRPSTRPTFPPRASSLRQPAGPGGIIARRPTTSRPPRLEVEIPPIRIDNPDTIVADEATPIVQASPALDSTKLRNNIQHTQRETVLNERESAIILREVELNDRNSALNLRDAGLRHREIALDQREAGFAQREAALRKKMEAIKGMMESQRQESEKLEKKQKEQMERLVEG